MLGVATVASPVAAANNIRVQVEIGIGAIFGSHAGSHRIVHVQWRSAEGLLKTNQFVRATGAGFWNIEPEVDEIVESGDRITTTVGGSSRTYVVERLTLAVDRETDLVTGTTSPNKSLDIEVDEYGGGFFVVNSYSFPVAANGNGDFALDFAGTVDIRGFDSVRGRRTNARGDQTVYGISVEAMRLWLGRSRIDLVGTPGSHVDVDLVRSSTTVSSISTFVGPDAFTFTSFVDDAGDRVRVLAGDDVSASFAADAAFAVPDVSAVVHKSTDKIVANCGEGPGIGIEVAIGDRFGFLYTLRYGWTNASGGFAANFSDEWDIRKGDKIWVYCKRPSGDVIVSLTTVG